jgi:NSS family neurotransmitter:Na+ symporter
MEQWSSKFGFILAAIGSAVGIGNIWRFSAVLGQNGGGAYLIPYLIAVFLFAMPLMILELAMGRHFRADVVTAFRRVDPRFHLIGWLICGIVFLILSYYLVITGWTVGYTLFSVAGIGVPFSAFTGGYLPLLLFVFTALVTGGIVSLGLRNGIERISILLIPVCVAILIIMAVYGAFLPGFPRAMEFLFTPDFSVLTNPLIWSAAFGQAFFSLSVGQGILLTYGAYVSRDQSLPSSAAIITMIDLSVAILAGVVIFPLVFSFGLTPAMGAELAFSTLPKAFAAMPAGSLFATSFFLVLFFAALTSSISMLEVSVASMREALDWSRTKTVALLTGIVLIVGLPSALSYSGLSLSLAGMRILDLMDETVGTLGLPVTAMLVAIAFTWFVPKRMLEDEIGGKHRLVSFIYPICKFVIPTVLFVTTAGRLLSGFDFPGTRIYPGSEFIGSLLQVEGVFFVIAILLAVTLLMCRVRGCRWCPRVIRKREDRGEGPDER